MSEQVSFARGIKLKIPTFALIANSYTGGRGKSLFLAIHLYFKTYHGVNPFPEKSSISPLFSFTNPPDNFTEGLKPGVSVFILFK